MYPALVSFVSAFAAISLFHLFATVPQWQSSSQAAPPIAASVSDDPAAGELETLGEQGEIVAQARAEVAQLLAGNSSCAAWFRAAEPEALEKFRSMRFTIDRDGPHEVFKLADSQGELAYFHPYVARTRQNVGWGSTITLNANGAFFKNRAGLHIGPGGGGDSYRMSSLPLNVGSYSGGTLGARIVTLLHEYGHVLDMLPIDSGRPSSPQISVQNTNQVLDRCGAQIRQIAKQSHFLVTASYPRQFSFTARPIHPGQINSKTGVRRPCAAASQFLRQRTDFSGGEEGSCLKSFPFLQGD